MTIMSLNQSNNNQQQPLDNSEPIEQEYKQYSHSNPSQEQLRSTLSSAIPIQTTTTQQQTHNSTFIISNSKSYNNNNNSTTNQNETISRRMSRNSHDNEAVFSRRSQMIRASFSNNNKPSSSSDQSQNPLKILQFSSKREQESQPISQHQLVQSQQQLQVYHYSQVKQKRVTLPLLRISQETPTNDRYAEIEEDTSILLIPQIPLVSNTAPVTRKSKQQPQFLEAYCNQLDALSQKESQKTINLSLRQKRQLFTQNLAIIQQPIETQELAFNTEQHHSPVLPSNHLSLQKHSQPIIFQSQTPTQHVPQQQNQQQNQPQPQSIRNDSLKKLKMSQRFQSRTVEVNNKSKEQFSITKLHFQQNHQHQNQQKQQQRALTTKSESQVQNKERESKEFQQENQSQNEKQRVEYFRDSVINSINFEAECNRIEEARKNGTISVFPSKSLKQTNNNQAIPYSFSTNWSPTIKDIFAKVFNLEESILQPAITHAKRIELSKEIQRNLLSPQTNPSSNNVLPPTPKETTTAPLNISMNLRQRLRKQSIGSLEQIFEESKHLLSSNKLTLLSPLSIDNFEIFTDDIMMEIPKDQTTQPNSSLPLSKSPNHNAYKRCVIKSTNQQCMILIKQINSVQCIQQSIQELQQERLFASTDNKSDSILGPLCSFIVESPKSQNPKEYVFYRIYAPFSEKLSTYLATTELNQSSMLSLSRDLILGLLRIHREQQNQQQEQKSDKDCEQYFIISSENILIEIATQRICFDTKRIEGLKRSDDSTTIVVSMEKSIQSVTGLICDVFSNNRNQQQNEESRMDFIPNTIRKIISAHHRDHLSQNFQSFLSQILSSISHLLASQSHHKQQRQQPEDSFRFLPVNESLQKATTEGVKNPFEMYTTRGQLIHINSNGIGMVFRVVKEIRNPSTKNGAAAAAVTPVHFLECTIGEFDPVKMVFTNRMLSIREDSSVYTYSQVSNPSSLLLFDNRFEDEIIQCNLSSAGLPDIQSEINDLLLHANEHLNPLAQHKQQQQQFQNAKSFIPSRIKSRSTNGTQELSFDSEEHTVTIKSTNTNNEIETLSQKLASKKLMLSTMPNSTTTPTSVEINYELGRIRYVERQFANRISFEFIETARVLLFKFTDGVCVTAPTRENSSRECISMSSDAFGFELVNMASYFLFTLRCKKNKQFPLTAIFDVHSFKLKSCLPAQNHAVISDIPLAKKGLLGAIIRVQDSGTEIAFGAFQKQKSEQKQQEQQEKTDELEANKFHLIHGFIITESNVTEVANIRLD